MQIDGAFKRQNLHYKQETVHIHCTTMAFLIVLGNYYINQPLYTQVSSTLLILLFEKETKTSVGSIFKQN